MDGEQGSTEEIKQRIKPILDNVAVDGLRAWLRSIDLPTAARTRLTITDFVAEQISKKQLAEPALEKALIGFEEASEMRIYLFRMEEVPAQRAEDWMPPRLKSAKIPISDVRKFAGDKTKAMSPVYGEIEGGVVRVKWAEEHRLSKLNESGDGIETKAVPKRIVLIADFPAKVAELRMNTPENGHAYLDENGRPTAEAYYNAYIEEARSILGVTLVPTELRPVIRKLVAEVDPRVVRIQIDNHTDQGNYKTTTVGPRADVRDSLDWQLGYGRNGASWVWEAQSVYWLPKVSHDSLQREVFSRIDAEEGFVKVNADCSDKEVTYVVSEIRAREGK